MNRKWPVILWLCCLPACGTLPWPGPGDDECFFEFGEIGITVEIGQDQLFGVSIPFDGTDLIVDGEVVGSVIIDGDRLTLTVTRPFLIADTDLFDEVFDADFDGDLVAGDCDTTFFYEGPGTITLGGSVGGTEETLAIFDVTLPALLE